MSRRPPSDTFTRFTSTTPHALQQPSSTFTYQPPSRSPAHPPQSSSSPSPARSPAPAGETPQEKVARLRAAARAAKAEAAYSPVERLIEHGRRWADRAHRFTAYGLILFAGTSVVVATYGTTSLIAHNRRQKRAWIERELDRLDDARQAFLRGSATAEQLHLLEQERAGEAMTQARLKEAERKKAESYWSRAKAMIGVQAAQGEMGQETAVERQQREARQTRRQRGSEESWVEGEIQPVAVAASGIKGVGVDSKGRPVPENTVEYARVQIADERRTGEGAVAARTGIQGGPLDVLADNVASAVQPTADSRGWFGWLRGGKS